MENTGITALHTANQDDAPMDNGSSKLESLTPFTLYGPELSYFTGKMEGVLRYMQLPYDRVTRGPIGEVDDLSGTAQVPALVLGDGRVLTDSTPMMEWLHAQNPAAPIIPSDPAGAYLSWMLDDYADEWLWRPAMHYRWDYAESAKHQSRVLADADEGDLPIPVPNALKRYLICNRQRKLFTRGDGVCTETWDHVESVFYNTLSQFSQILKSRPFLLGDRPSIADFGFFGPMFRHFAMDPTSARIMRETASPVFEWVARVWNARVDDLGDRELLNHVPDDWDPILRSIGSQYLPHLRANANAWQTGREKFDVTIEGVAYHNIRMSEYRVWCLDELRRRFEALDSSDQEKVRERLERTGCWQALWQVDLPASVREMGKDVPFSGVGGATGVSKKSAYKFYLLPVSAPRPPKVSS